LKIKKIFKKSFELYRKSADFVFPAAPETTRCLFEKTLRMSAVGELDSRFLTSKKSSRSY
jgi:hypothetical protein